MTRRHMMRLAPVAPERYLTREVCESIWLRVLAATHQGGETACTISSRWNGNIRWVKNQPQSAGDILSSELRITRTINGREGMWSTDRLDDQGIIECVRAAEFATRYSVSILNRMFPPLGQQEYAPPLAALWNASTYDFGTEARSAAAHDLTQPALSKKLLQAGYLEIVAHAACIANSTGIFAYGAETQASCAMTARSADGTASGWAGTTASDWTRLDAMALASRAIEKCEQSANPVAVEPGRYTVILEPQAVAQFVDIVMESGSYRLSRSYAEAGGGPFAGEKGFSKIGLRVFDERLMFTSDPMDPEMPGIPFEEDTGEPLAATTWVADGVLKALAYDRRYGVMQLRKGRALPFQPYRVTGTVSAVSMDEMIRTTERGLLVTRFNDIATVGANLMCSGVTRDGVWLIERGAITRPVKNLRFTESPMIILNNVEQIGASTRVYLQGVTVPPLKVKDFSFTSLSDAI